MGENIKLSKKKRKVKVTICKSGKAVGYRSYDEPLETDLDELSRWGDATHVNDEEDYDE